jgi:hypothetical protein
MYTQIIKYLQKYCHFSEWAQLQRLFTSIINEKPKHIQIPVLIAETYGAQQEQGIAAGACLALV